MSLLVRKTARIDSFVDPPANASDFYLALDPILIESAGLTEGNRIEGRIKGVLTHQGEIPELKGEAVSFIVGSVPTMIYISEKSWNSLFEGKNLGAWEITLTAELKGI